MIVLPDAEDRRIISLFLWTKHRNVTDRQAVCIASSVDAL